MDIVIAKENDHVNFNQSSNKEKHLLSFNNCKTIFARGVIKLDMEHFIWRGYWATGSLSPVQQNTTVVKSIGFSLT